MTENQYQAKLIKKLERRFYPCIVLKNDPSYQQGIPDLILLHNNCWAFLEVKASINSSTQPNQDFFIEQLDNMSFAAYIYPENEREVLDAIQQAFESPRGACIPQS